jgi:hypothetical protein
MRKFLNWLKNKITPDAGHRYRLQAKAFTAGGERHPATLAPARRRKLKRRT